MNLLMRRRIFSRRTVKVDWFRVQFLVSFIPSKNLDECSFAFELTVWNRQKLVGGLICTAIGSLASSFMDFNFSGA